MAEPIDALRWIFLNKKDEARCGWRIAAFLLAFIVSGILFGGLITAVARLIPALGYLAVEPSPSGEFVSGHELAYLASDKLITLIATISATAFCAVLLERRTFSSIGFKLHPGWLRDLAVGSLVGSVALACAVGIVMLKHAADFQLRSDRAFSLVVSLGFSLLFMFVAAATEELLFRGFVFQALAYDLGPVVAVLGTSILFGVLHIPNPNSTLFSTINTILAGIWLGIAYLKTRSLWFATGLHFSWNFVQASIFGLPVSGLTVLQKMSLLQGSSGEPRWLTGLDYGPEGGLAATLTLAASTVLILRADWLRVTEEMKLATRHGARYSMPSIS
ncbi:MAG TPA: type II CAAX endopeptidase family protein [Blastocatellia bacterium]|nr:type II CAAX endopeptidase family protein [Blastocatellia bacterium]